MKSYIITLLIALSAGYLGAKLNQQTAASANGPDSGTDKLSVENDSTAQTVSPFQIQNTESHTQLTLEELRIKINRLENKVTKLASQQADILSLAENTNNKTTTRTRRNRVIQPNKNNLSAAGIAPDIADDILRRMGQQKYRRLELQGLIRRADPASRRQYNRELQQLNQKKISLRTELGDDAYDQYLFSSGQNNRVMVSSVMAGSPAESAGFLPGDIILLYDNSKILSWPDIRKATLQGETGSYANVEVLRDGAQMSMMVPTGPLGVELEPTQLDPAQ